MRINRFLLALAVCAGTAYGMQASQPKAKRKPNIIVIISDDAGYADFSMHGCKQFATPHIDSIAKNGKKTHLFLLSGQSNMARLNPNISFTPTLKKAFPDDEVIVTKVAYGGRPIAQWVPRAKIYKELVKKVKTDTAGKEFSTITFVWMQGERDHRSDAATRTYKANLLKLYAQLTEDFKRNDINWVIGRLSDARVGTANWDAIRKIQVNVAKKHPRAAWIDTDDLNGPKNDIHCTPEGYRKMGVRFAEQAIALIKQD